MSIPSVNLTNGVYFGSLNGYNYSSFEKAKRGNNSYFRRACTLQNKIHFYENGNNYDLYSLAYVPFTSSDVSSSNTSYFVSSSYSQWGIKPKIIIRGMGENQSKGYFPLSLAFSGYRIMQGNCASTFSGGTVSPFNIISKNGTGAATVTINRTSVGGTPWKDADGNNITRNTCGIVLVGSGAMGDFGAANKDGSGGAGGGYFIGFFDLTKCNSITVYAGIGNNKAFSDDNAITSRIDIDGKRVVTAYAGEKYRGPKRSQGGAVSISNHAALFRWFSANGCYGGNSDNDNGQSFSSFTLAKGSPDDGVVTFASRNGGIGKPENNGGGGGGGASLCGKGGDCGKRTKNGQNGGYGAGGGGGGDNPWGFIIGGFGTTRQGDGGNGVYLVGY